MFRSLVLAGALFVMPFVANAQDFTPYTQMPAGVYNLDKTHASLTWKVSHAGLSNYTARFTDFDAQINFQPEDLTTSSISLTISPFSVMTDYVATEEKDFNKNLATQKQWFNANDFSAIEFKSTQVVKTGENTGQVYGNLTMLGVSKPVIMDVVYNGAYAEQPFSQLPTLGFSASTKIRRSDWGMDTYIPMIGDEVTIIFEGEFAKND